jgi:hypothetical protein
MSSFDLPTEKSEGPLEKGGRGTGTVGFPLNPSGFMEYNPKVHLFAESVPFV